MNRPITSFETRANDEGWWPASPHTRSWSTITMYGVTASVCIATWVFVIGATVASYLNFTEGLMAMVAGSLLGALIPVLAVLPTTATYGIDSVAALRPQMGTRGAYLGLILLALSVIGWNSVLVIFLGRASAEIMVSLGVISSDAALTAQIVVAAASLFGVWLALWKGASSVSMVGTLVAIAVVALGAAIFFLIINGFGWDHLLQAEPSAPTPSHRYNFTTGFELLVAVNLGWWPYIGGLVRLGRGPRQALWPLTLGIGLPVGLMSAIGLAAALLVPSSGGDPTVFLLQLGGPVGGIPMLLFIVLANYGTILIGTYVFTVGIGQVKSLQGKVSWNTCTFLSLFPLFVISTFFSNEVYGNLPIFLAIVGLTFAPVCGIQIADRYLLRRKISLSGIFFHGPGTPYHYLGGVNPIGLVAIALGIVTYVYLLHPLTFESRWPYEFVTASLPAVILPGLCYAALMKWVAPKEWLEPTAFTPAATSAAVNG